MQNIWYRKCMSFGTVLMMILVIFTATVPMNVSADCPDDCPSGMMGYWKLDETSAGLTVTVLMMEQIMVQRLTNLGRLTELIVLMGLMIMLRFQVY